MRTQKVSRKQEKTSNKFKLKQILLLRIHFTSPAAHSGHIFTNAHFVICTGISTFKCQIRATFSMNSRLLFRVNCEQHQKQQGLNLSCDLCRNQFGVHRPQKNLLSDCWCSCLYMNHLYVSPHTNTHTDTAAPEKIHA